MRIYFDTETTDFWNFGRPPVDDSQPFPLQVAAVLETEDGRTVAALACVLAQHMWPFPDDSRRTMPRVRLDPRIVELCGLTDQHVDGYGQNPTLIFNQLRLMFGAAQESVAHNIEFDMGVLKRWARALHVPEIEVRGPFCTMRESAEIVAIRKASGGLKWPKLAEAYSFFERRPMTGAHDAMADAYACRRVYRGIARHRAASAAPA
jgi:DNA polymerase-3 subunit epsilon